MFLELRIWEYKQYVKLDQIVRKANPVIGGLVIVFSLNNELARWVGTFWADILLTVSVAAFAGLIGLLFVRYFPGLYSSSAGMLHIHDSHLEFISSERPEVREIPIGDVKSVTVQLLGTSKRLFRRRLVHLQCEISGRSEQALVVLREGWEQEAFRIVLEHWYGREVPLYECDGMGRKTFLFNSHYRYHDIQEIKRQYHIKWREIHSQNDLHANAS